jgi:hypothetical protein
LETGGGAFLKSTFDKEVAIGVDGVAAPEEHLLIKSCGQIPE